MLTLVVLPCSLQILFSLLEVALLTRKHSVVSLGSLTSISGTEFFFLRMAKFYIKRALIVNTMPGTWCRRDSVGYCWVLCIYCRVDLFEAIDRVSVPLFFLVKTTGMKRLASFFSSSLCFFTSL